MNTSMIGKVFGRLTVLSQAESHPKGGTRWNCSCSCGKTTVVERSSLVRGRTRSCGCIRAAYLQSPLKRSYFNSSRGQSTLDYDFDSME